MVQALFITFITSAALLWLLTCAIEKPDAALRTIQQHFRQWSLPQKTAVILYLYLTLLSGGLKPPLPEASTSEPPTPALVVTEPLLLDPPAPVTTNRLTESQCAASLALVSASSNTTPLVVPANATLYQPWTIYGVAEATFYLPATNWSFIIGTNAVEGAHLSSSGLISFNNPISTSQPNLLTNFTNLSLLSPLHGSFGIVPPIGHFWQAPTPSNSMLFTWESVYASRDTNAPISFQIELFANGDFTYRYDFTQLPTNYWPLLTNYTISAQHNGGGEAYRIENATNLPERLELNWRAFGLLDPTLEDNDADGLSDYEEVFIHNTSPSMPDTDLDGLSDYDEILLGTNPFLRDTDSDGLVDGSDPDPITPTSVADSDNNRLPDAWEECYFGSAGITDATADPNGDGFNNLISLLAGINPTNAPLPGFAVANQPLPLGLDAWEIAPAFGLETMSSLNNLFERTISVERTSPWQQFYVSSKPDRAAGWCMDGMTLYWSIDEEEAGQTTCSAGDSLHLPTTNTYFSAISFRIEATTTVGMLQLPTPLYLIRWTPQLLIEATESVHKVADTNNMMHIAALADRVLPFEVDLATRPQNAPLSCFEIEQLSCQQPISDPFVTFQMEWYTAPNPLRGFMLAQKLTKFILPATGTNAPCKLLFVNPVVDQACTSDATTLGSSHYPLNSRALRSYWHANAVAEGSAGSSGFTLDLGVQDEALGCQIDGIKQNCYSWADESINFMANSMQTSNTNCTLIEILLCGSNIWSWCETQEPDNYDEETERDPDNNDDCACGDCNEEGAELGSLRFRIPLGSEGRERISGYLWLEMNQPLPLSLALVKILADSTVAITTNNAHSITLACVAERGRNVIASDYNHSLQFSVYDDFNTLQHTWQITAPANHHVQVVKKDAANNTISDETYSYIYDVWHKLDNLSGLEERLQTQYDLNGFRYESRETRLNGNRLSYSYSRARRLDNDNSSWLTEYDYFTKGNRLLWERASAYYKDSPGNKRHGRMKFRYDTNSGNWEYYNYDTRGRVTLSATSFNGSWPPSDLQYGDITPVSVEELALISGLVAKVVVQSYQPLFDAADTAHLQDARKPRETATWIVADGEAQLISRVWHVYTRAISNDLSILTERTIKAAAPLSAFNDPANAHSSTTRFCGYEDAEMPPELWNLPLCEEEADNTLRTWEYELGDWENNLFTPNPSGSHLRVTQRVGTTALPDGLPNISAFTVEIRNIFGATLHRETRLYTGTEAAPLLDWEASTYDQHGHLLATHYADGTALSNIWDCCRLQARHDRNGAKIEFLEIPGVPLWSAEAQTSNANLPGSDGYYPVTEYLRDSAGRVTNTIQSLWQNGVPAASHTPLQTHTLYPGTSDDYSIHIDSLGIATTNYIHSSSGDETRTETSAGVTRLTTRYKNGATIHETQWDGKWRRETQKEEYNVLGQRLELQLTEASDAPMVTNSVTLYDFLGRALTTITPLGTTSNFYDGASTRLTRTSRTDQPDTLYVYDELGNVTATVLDTNGDRQVSYAGIDRISSTVTRYEEDVSNNWWRVTLSVECVGGVTNIASVVSEQFTGLSPALLSRTVTIDANVYTTSVTRALESGTDIIVETSWTGVAAPSVRRMLYGHLIKTAGLGESILLEYDGFARNVSQTVTNAAGMLSLTTLTYDTLGNVVTNITTYGDLNAVNAIGYDGQGRAVSQTDALGNTVATAYDSLGQTLSLSGATYPVCYAYDTVGRQTELSTTRDGLTWDKTCFLYDSVTGLLTNKVYADNSRVSYTYTKSGRLLRTTWARGAWKENIYDNLGQITETAYSDGTPDITFTRNAFGSVTNVIDAAGLSHSYAVNQRQSVTNETVISGAFSNTLTRLLDEFNRPVGLLLDDGYSLFYGRDSENRICVVSNADFTAHYHYTNGYAVGHTLALSNGNMLARSITRDRHRPWLVTDVTNLFNGAAVSSFAYEYDILGRVIRRNADSFGYNARSELSSALLHTNAYGYVVDCIGNRLISTNGGGQTTYTVNNLNQYTAINTTARYYDADGNLLEFGTWGYGWDAENRLTEVSSNGVSVLANSYDYRHRRVRKATPFAVREMLYDGWNLIRETVASVSGPVSTNRNYWGLDLSGSLQGAGGIGGLLAICRNGTYYFPLYDNNGNVTEYVDASGTVRAHYEYSPFGEIIAQTGDLADIFPHRFSTKYYDMETCSYYYGYRHYVPEFGCWYNRDPIEEQGGLHLYGFVVNNPANQWDALGLAKNDTLTQHFNQLKTQLQSKLKALCPQKKTEWTNSANRKLCCDPNSCQQVAMEIAEAYITALEEAYKARPKIFRGWPLAGTLGNLWAGERGQEYPANILTCNGWYNMAVTAIVLPLGLNRTDGGGRGSACWAYRRKNNFKAKDRATGDDIGHTWISLQVMDGNGIDLDPWPNGGWTY